jgi:uncharacterized protein YybS (DUF2232 family)
MVVLGALTSYLLFGAAGALGAGAVLVNLFTPLPAAVLGMRLGPPWGVAAVGLTIVAVLATSGVVPALLYQVQFGLPAMLIPWLLRRGVSWDRTVFTTLGLTLALGVVVLIGSVSGSGQSPVDFVNEQVDREIEQTITLMNEFAGAEQSPADAEAFRQVVAGMGDVMRRAYPAMLVVVCGALQLVTVGLLAFVVRPGVLPGLPFARWRSPELLIWVLIAAGFAGVFGTGGLQSVAINALIMLLPLYFLQGLAVVENFLARRGLSPLLRGVCYLFLLVVNPLPVIVTGVGVFDLWADFRKPRPNKD